MRIGGATRALVALALALGCVLPQAGYESREERSAGTPLPRSENPRSGRLTWKRVRLAQDEEGVRVELRLRNGTSIGLRYLTLRVILVGPRGEEASARVGVGAIAGRGERLVSVRLPPPGFPVHRIELELVSLMHAWAYGIHATGR